MCPGSPHTLGMAVGMAVPWFLPGDLQQKRWPLVGLGRVVLGWEGSAWCCRAAG